MPYREIDNKEFVASHHYIHFLSATQAAREVLKNTISDPQQRLAKKVRNNTLFTSSNGIIIAHKIFVGFGTGVTHSISRCS